RNALLRDIRDMAKAAKANDPMGTIKQLRQNLRVSEEKLSQRREPAETLAFWVPVLQNERERLDLARAAEEDVKRGLDDPSAKQDAKGKALLVQGLILRNEDKFTEAAASLEKAREALQGAKGDWLAITETVLREVKNPAGEFTRKAQQLSDQGKVKEA